MEIGEEMEWISAQSQEMQQYYNDLAGNIVDEYIKANPTGVKVDGSNNLIGSEYDLPRDGTAPPWLAR